MRSFILGIVVLMAVPTYGLGQQRERSATPRTAVPRDGQAAIARQSDRRAEPRTEVRSPSPREERSSVAVRSESPNRDTPSTAETVRGRSHSQLRQPAQPFTWWTNAPRPPSTFARPARVFPQLPNADHRRPAHDRRYSGSGYHRPHGGANVLFVPYASPVIVEREVVIERNETVSAPVIVEQPSLARLILDIHPATAQIFADGYYIGIPDDFRHEHGGAVLEPGPHRIDILARDHEPVSFDVNLARGQSATFRRILTPIVRAQRPVPDAAVKAPAVVKQPITFYLIPGCYMGNVPPKEANLPAACDIARAVSLQY